MTASGRLRGWLALAFSLLAASRLGAEPQKFTKEQWKVHQGKWQFEDGELVCLGKGRSSLIYRRGFRARDLELSVQVKFLGPDSSAGLVFRGAGKSYYRDITFYQFEWYTKGSHHGRRLSLMRKTPRWKQIVKPIVRDPPMNRWITFRVRARGPLIECFIDDEKVFSRRDRAFFREGSVGLHVFQPRTVRFRRPAVKALEER
jgi:hypothetical protein